MGKRILLCDDAAFIRVMLRDILVRNGYTIAGEAENGKRAVEQYRALRPDLTLLDTVMPEMDGFKALEEILSFDPDANIVMIGAWSESSALECIRAGAKGSVKKPFATADLLAQVKAVCG